jgi:hypothetical protein
MGRMFNKLWKFFTTTAIADRMLTGKMLIFSRFEQSCELKFFWLYYFYCDPKKAMSYE